MSSVSNPILAAVELTAALPIPVVIAGGPIALWGIPLGILLSDAAFAAIGAGTLVALSAHLFLGYAAAKLASRFGLDPHDSASAVLRARTVGTWLAVITVAALGAAAVAGWTSEALHVASFFVVTPIAFVEFVVLTAVLGVPLFAILRRFGPAITGLLGAQWPDPELPSGRFDRRWVVAVSLAWPIVGVVGSVGYRIFTAVPADVFTARGLDALLVLRDPGVVGHGASRAQILLGAVGLTLLFGLYWGLIRPRAGDSR